MGSLAARLTCCSLVLFSLCAPRLTAAEPFIGAGILPYCVHQDQVLVLLGFDWEKEAWTDFGGSPELVASLSDGEKRWETQRQTAVREGVEESRGTIGRRQLEGGIAEGRFFDHPELSYRSFTAKIDYIPLERFGQALIPLDKRWEHWREKTNFYWIGLEQLKTQVREAKDRYSAFLTQAPGGSKPLFSYLYDSLAEEFARGEDKRLFPR